MPDLDHDKLSVYLNQHLSGADAGVQSFRAAADTWAGTVWEQRLRTLADELEASHATLKQTIEQLGYQVGPLRTVATAVTTTVGRVFPANPTRDRDGKFAQLELDLLVGALSGQQMLWETLRALSAVDERIVGEQCARMVALVEDQIARVRELSASTCVERFTA